MVRRIPLNSEGSDGDIALGNTKEGYKLYVKMNNKWITFSPDKPEIPVSHYVSGSFQQASGHAALYLPFAYGDDDGSAAARNTDFIVPFNCFAKRLILRAENAGGSTSVVLYKAKDGTAHPTTVVDSVSRTMGAANTRSIFDFTGAKLYEGDIIAVSVAPGAQLGDT